MNMLIITNSEIQNNKKIKQFKKKLKQLMEMINLTIVQKNFINAQINFQNRTYIINQKYNRMKNNRNEQTKEEE